MFAMTSKADRLAPTRLFAVRDGERTNLLQPGALLNSSHRIEALIGRGGMGEVYRASNIHTGDQDAIKVIRRDLAGDPQIRELFRREAGALRKMRHPAVVSYQGAFGDESGRLFLVMEYVEGPSLAAVIPKAPLSSAEVRRLGAWIAEGLGAAHAGGVVHRDLSPDNIVLRGGDLGQAVLIDFGVAKSWTGSAPSSATALPESWTTAHPNSVVCTAASLTIAPTSTVSGSFWRLPPAASPCPWARPLPGP
jgi:serine/threonine protein kinase